MRVCNVVTPTENKVFRRDECTQFVHFILFLLQRVTFRSMSVQNCPCSHCFESINRNLLGGFVGFVVLVKLLLGKLKLSMFTVVETRGLYEFKI